MSGWGGGWGGGATGVDPKNGQGCTLQKPREQQPAQRTIFQPLFHYPKFEVLQRRGKRGDMPCALVFSQRPRNAN